MDLIQLNATNVCSFEHIELPLDQQGLVWIGGLNEDTEGAVSNGSGKSNLFNAISWVLYGETTGDDDPDKIIRIGTRAAHGTIDCQEGETMWRIERERRKGSPRLHLYRDGVAQHGGRLALQARIDSLLGLDFEAFRNTVMYGQRDLKRFIEPRVSDATRKETLQRILRTSVYGVCHKWVMDKHLQVKRVESGLELELAALRARLDENDLDALEAESEQWEADRHARFDAARSLAKRLALEVSTLRSSAPDVESIEASLAALRDRRSRVMSVLDRSESLDGRIDELNARFNDAVIDRKVKERAAQELDERLTTLEGESRCPLCGDDLTGKSGSSHLDELRAAFETATDEWHQSAEEASNAKSALDSVIATRSKTRALSRLVRQIDDDISLANDELNDAREHDRRIETALARVQEAMERARAISKELNPITSRLESARERRAELSKLVDAKEIELNEAIVLRAHYEFWTRGFGPTGLPSFTLDTWMPYLTERANHYLEVLSDGDITMTFATRRELKTKGEFRDEIAINWRIEGVDDYPPNGASFKKMSLATDFALMDMACSREGASLNILCIDECLDGLDVEGRQRVLQLLHKLRSRRSSIFVISHELDIAEVFERAIHVTKTGGVSRMEAT